MNRRSLFKAALAAAAAPALVLPRLGAAAAFTAPQVTGIERGRLSHIEVASVGGLFVYDLILVGPMREPMLITKIDPKTKTLTVIRDYGSVL